MTIVMRKHDVNYVINCLYLKAEASCHKNMLLQLLNYVQKHGQEVLFEYVNIGGASISHIGPVTMLRVCTKN